MLLLTVITDEMLAIHQERVQCTHANKILASNLEFHKLAAQDKRLIQNFVSLKHGIPGAMSANELFPVVDAMVRESFGLIVEALKEHKSTQPQETPNDTEGDEGELDETILVVESLLLHLEMYNPLTLERLVNLLFQLTSRGKLDLFYI